MKAIFFLSLLTGLALAGCKPRDPAGSPPPTGSENPLDAPARYGGALIQGQKQAVKTADLASLNQAIKMFQAQEDRFPKDLQELVSPDYLPRLPEPPNGMKFDYNPQSGEVKVVPK